MGLMKMSDPETDQKFERIVDDNDLEQVVIRVAASDARLKKIVRRMLSDPVYSKSEEAILDRTALLRDLGHRMGFETGSYDEVLNECESIVTEEEHEENQN